MQHEKTNKKRSQREVVFFLRIKKLDADLLE